MPLSVQPITVGLVCPSRGDAWLGGLNYIQHLASCGLRRGHGLRFRDVWWGEECPVPDPFEALRSDLGPPAELGMPGSLWGRAARFLRRPIAARHRGDLRDVFSAAGIDVLFPDSPCAHPGVPVVGWITDLQYLHLPQYYTSEQAAFFEGLYAKVLRDSALVMVSSEAALSDVARTFPLHAAKARVLRPCSVPTEHWWRLDPEQVRLACGLPTRYFVVSNQVCAHKNHRTILQAVALLRSRGISVAIACTGRTADYRQPAFFEHLLDEARAFGVIDQVRFLGALPREQHVAVLRGAIAVIQPSEFEGWGFALSDAKALGKPALASDLPVHHEHGHPEAELLPVCDVDAWAAAMARLWRTGPAGLDPRAEELAREENIRDQMRVAAELMSLFSDALRMSVLSAERVLRGAGSFS